MLKSDFEMPIRELPNKISEWRKIHDQESALDKTLKDYEKTAAKLDKASSKSKSSKADVLQNEIDQITRTLSIISPDYYKTCQRLDEERLKVLKEVIVRWGTVKGDIASRAAQRAESNVAGLLGWETSDEVLSVGRKLGGGGGGGGANRFPTLPSHSQSNNSTRKFTAWSHDTADQQHPGWTAGYPPRRRIHPTSPPGHKHAPMDHLPMSARPLAGVRPGSLASNQCLAAKAHWQEAGKMVIGAEAKVLPLPLGVIGMVDLMSLERMKLGQWLHLPPARLPHCL